MLHDFVKHAHAKPFTGRSASAQEAEAAGATAAAVAAAAEPSAATLQQAPVPLPGSNRRVQRTGFHTGSCNVRHSQSPDPEKYLVALRWGTPACSPSPQHKINGSPSSSSRAASPQSFPSSSPHPGGKPLPNPGTAVPALDSASSQLQADGTSVNALRSNFRTVSPSVARACVTLPGFCPPPRGQASRDRGPSIELEYPHHEQSQHDNGAQGQHH